MSFNKYKGKVVESEQERQSYNQQLREQQDFEAYKKNEEAEKKRRLQAEMAEHYQQQIREKQYKASVEKQRDNEYTRTILEESSFANQDKQRDQLLSKLKTQGSQYNQGTQQNRGNKTDIFNNEIYERPQSNVQISNPDDERAEKKRKEREIFEENQRVASYKKSLDTQQKSDQKLIDYHRNMNDYDDFQKEKELKQYRSSVQKEETRRALGDQIGQKVSNTQNQKYDYYQQQQQYANEYENSAPIVNTDYSRNKQKASGAGYNILTGN